MSRLGINTGVTANDGQGDSIRSAMGKVNSNFQEIYTTFGDTNNLISYASTAGISTLSKGLTGNPILNVSGVLNTGITTTEKLEVRDIVAAGVVTAVQFIGDGSQLENVVATNSGVEVLDDNVRKGVAKELNFGQGIFCSGPDGVGRVTIAITTSVVSGGGTGVVVGVTSLEVRNKNVVFGEFAKIDFGENLVVVGNNNTGIATITGIVTTANNLLVSGISTFSGGQVWNSDITWNTGVNINASGESSIDVRSGGQFGLWDNSISSWYLKAEYGTPLKIGLNGQPVLVGTETTTGTSSQNLQVSGGAFISGGVGIGTTTPKDQVLYVEGDARITGTLSIGSSTVVIDGNTNTLSVENLVATSISGAGISESLVGYATEGYVNNLVSISTFSGNYNDLSNLPTVAENLSDLNDVTISGISTGQVLKWNGSNWYAGPDNAASGSGASVTASDSAPSLPSSGDLWWKSDEGRLKVYYDDGSTSQWVDASPPGSPVVTASDTAPGNPGDGSLWWKSDEGRLKIYYRDGDSDQWVDANPPLANTSIADGTTYVTVTNNEINFITDGSNKWGIGTDGHFVPNGDATYNIGSADNRVANVYSADLHLSNENTSGNDIDGTTGNWTIQEGSDDLFLINNKTGKRYKFTLTEV